MFLRGVVQVQERKIESLSGQIVDAKVRAMKDNIVISGIVEPEEEESEDCVQNVLSFFNKEMAMETKREEIRTELVKSLQKTIQGKWLSNVQSL